MIDELLIEIELKSSDVDDVRVTSRPRHNSFKSILSSRLSLPVVEGRSASYENIHSTVAKDDNADEARQTLSASLSSSGVISDKDDSSAQLRKRKLSTRLLSFFRKTARQAHIDLGKNATVTVKSRAILILCF